MFVEVDEQQHEDLRPKNPSGAVIAPNEVPADQPDQERERMMDIVMAQTKPVVFIRYNPDRYTYVLCRFLFTVLLCFANRGDAVSFRDQPQETQES